MINPKETVPTNNITPIIRIGKPAQFTATTGVVQGVIVAATGITHGSRKTVLYAIVDTLGGFHYATQECVSPITKKPTNRTTVPKLKQDIAPRKSPNPRARNIDFGDRKHKQFGRIELVQQNNERWLREQIERRCKAFLVKREVGNAQ